MSEQNPSGPYNPIITPARLVGGKMLKFLEGAASLYDESQAALRGAQSSLHIVQAELASAYGELDAQKKSNAELHEEARVDELTGLLNRRGLNEALSRALDGYLTSRHVRRNDGLHLIMIDIDNFKQYNEDRSHAVGDQVLQQVAAASQIAIRADQGDILGRWGGDEFVAILRTNGEIAGGAAERIRGSVDGLTDCTVSVGIFDVDDFSGFSTTEQYYDAASQAVKKAKQANPDKNAVHFLNPQDYIE